MDWTTLEHHPSDVFGTGVLVRFSAPDTNGIKIIAMAVAIPGQTSLSFFEISGGNSPGSPMGYLNPTLPADSIVEGRAYSLSKQWLLQNFDYVCLDVDPREIEVLEYFTVEPDPLY